METLLKKIDSISAPASTNGDLFSGIWRNQLGSTMHLTITEGRVTGLYSTPVGKPEHKESELVGFVIGDLITFTVNFGQSLAAWSGQIQTIEGKQDELITMWHLVTNVDDANEPNGMWQATFTGSDRFTKADITNSADDLPQGKILDLGGA